MLFMLDEQSLTVLDMEYNSLTHIMKIFILWNGIKHVISTELIQYISDNGRIRAFGSDEFSSFIMNFMNIEDSKRRVGTCSPRGCSRQGTDVCLRGFSFRLPSNTERVGSKYPPY